MIKILKSQIMNLLKLELSSVAGGEQFAKLNMDFSELCFPIWDSALPLS